MFSLGYDPCVEQKGTGTVLPFYQEDLVRCCDETTVVMATRPLH